MRTTVVAALAFIIFSVLVSTQPPRYLSPPYLFRNVRINGGGFVAATIFSRTEKDLIYARTDMGGVYRWTNVTGRWIPLLDDLGTGNMSYLGTLALATDPVQPSRVYLACGLYTNPGAAEAAVLYSEEYGALGTWTAVPLPGVRLGGNEDGRSAGERLAVLPHNNSLVFLGTSQDGLWGSSDKGVSWAPVPSWPPSLPALMFLLPHAQTGLLFAGVEGVGADTLLWSPDDGATWTPVPGAPPTLTPYRGSADAGGSTLYFSYSAGVGPNGMTSGRVWSLSLTTSGARQGEGRGRGAFSASWRDVTPTQTSGGGFAGVSADPSVPGTLMVTTMDRWSPDLIYRSLDGGTTWVELVHNAVTVTDTPWVTFHDRGGTPSWTGWMGDIAIDPFDSNRVFHGTGQGLWLSVDVTAADVGGAPTTWSFSNDGLEETVPLELLTPPGGGPVLVSAIGDIDGFVHNDLDVTPPQGMFNPSWGTGQGLDVAWLTPSFYVRTHALGYGTGNLIHGSFSVDGGLNWTLFPSQPDGAGQESIAVRCDGALILWHGAYSEDNGTSWSACGGGLPPSAQPVADRVDPTRMYAYAHGTVWVSSDGGRSFGPGASSLPPASNFIRASFASAGELWVPTLSALLRSTDHGSSVAHVAGPSTVWSVGLGAAMEAGGPPAVYLHGVVEGEEGFWRSDDAGGVPTPPAPSWVRVNDWGSKFGFVMFVTGDSNTAGRMYVATNGRGILVGESRAF